MQSKPITIATAERAHVLHPGATQNAALITTRVRRALSVDKQADPATLSLN